MWFLYYCHHVYIGAEDTIRGHPVSGHNVATTWSSQQSWSCDCSNRHGTVYMPQEKERSCGCTVQVSLPLVNISNHKIN